MEIQVNGKSLDLYQDTDATIKFQIQVSKDVTQRVVSVTDTFSIPASKENKLLIDPIITGNKKFTNVSVIFENGFSFNATMYIRTSDEYVFGEEYSVKLVSSLAEQLDSIGKDGIEKLFLQDNFKYIFMDDASYGVPTDETSSWYFLTASNRNGTNYDNLSNFPVYSDKLIDSDRKSGQLFITISIYSFLNKVFDTYNISHSINPKDIIMDGVSLDEVYIFIPVKLQSLDERTVSFEVSDLVKKTNTNELITVSDDLGFLGMQADVFTAVTDTVFDISTSGTVGIKFKHRYGDHLTCDHAVIYNSGYVTLYVNIYKDGDIYKRLKICEFGDSPDSVGLPNDANYVTVSLSDLIQDVETLATTEFTFSLGAIFTDYDYIGGNSVYDPINQECVGEQTSGILNGEYPPDYGDPQGGEYYEIDIDGNNGIPILFNSVENISPCTLEYNGNNHIDTIDMATTMKLTKLKIKDIINDILIRFNAGFYVDSHNDIKFGTFVNRYDINNKIKLTSWENGYQRTYNQDVMGIFDYKNKSDDRIYGAFKDDENRTRLIGDVDNQNFGGDKNETIVLKSSYVDKNIYKKNFHDTTGIEDELISYQDSDGRIFGREWCGVPFNEELKNDELNVMIGFLGPEKTLNKIYIPYVDMVELPTEGNLPTVTYLRNSNISLTSLNGNIVTLYYPEKESSYLSANLYLGDSIKHEVDSNTKLYNNFIPVLNPYDNYITINAIVDIDIINNILDGYIITLLNGDGTEQDYYPLEVSGISLEKEYSIAEIKMIKKL